MRVRDIMHSDVITVTADTTVVAAASVLDERSISSLVVADGTRPVGIITERDCVRAIARCIDPAAATVAQLMSDHLVTISAQEDVTEAAELMREHHIRHLPVVDGDRLVGIVSMRDPVMRHPALRRVEEERRQSAQARIADAVTAFAGSMKFVYLHMAWFALWIVGRVEKYPYGLLTMIVSLEAIFLSTFVMISQNRADAKRSALADHQWVLVQHEEAQNDQLLELSQRILDLTGAIHDLTCGPNGELQVQPSAAAATTQ
jgi:CBS domain-containing protein/uncharacterized membrane protein